MLVRLKETAVWKGCFHGHLFQRSIVLSVRGESMGADDTLLGSVRCQSKPAARCWSVNGRSWPKTTVCIVSLMTARVLQNERPYGLSPDDLDGAGVPVSGDQAGRHEGDRQARGPEAEAPALADRQRLVPEESGELLGGELEGFVEIERLEHRLFEP